MYITTYAVQGRYSFPVDMLRYDQSFPATQEAVSAMHASDTIPRVGFVRVELQTIHKYREPALTTARWNSFAWGIVPKSIRTRKV